jgi:anti-anti-sigma factor
VVVPRGALALKGLLAGGGSQSSRVLGPCYRQETLLNDREVYVLLNEVPELVVSVERPEDGRVVVAVAGELDLAGAGKLHPVLLDAVASPLTVLDLSSCLFCDSSGLRTIVEASRRAGEAGNAFRVAGVGSSVARVFELSGVDEFLSLFPDAEAALKA